MDKKHFLPNAKDRKVEWYHPLYKMSSKSLKEYNRVEDLLDECTCDLINGKSKSDIIIKLESGLYENQHKKVSHKTALEYYNCILSRLQIDEPEKDKGSTDLDAVIEEAKAEKKADEEAEAAARAEAEAARIAAEEAEKASEESDSEKADEE